MSHEQADLSLMGYMPTFLGRSFVDGIHFLADLSLMGHKWGGGGNRFYLEELGKERGRAKEREGNQRNAENSAMFASLRMQTGDGRLYGLSRPASTILSTIHVAVGQ